MKNLNVDYYFAPQSPWTYLGHARLVVLIFLFVLSCASIGQTAKKNCPPALPTLTNEQWIEKAKTAKPAGFLWKVEKHGQVSWLYGTMHINNLELAMPSPVIVNAIKQVDIVALELDVSTPEKSLALAAEVSKPVLGATPLDDKTIARIKKYTESLCLPTDYFLKLPLPILKLALPVHALRAKGLYSEFMVDAFIGGLGTGLKKKVMALETVKIQTNALSQPNPGRELIDLNETLQKLELGDTQKLMQQIFDAWSKSDIAKFEQFFDWCECMRTPEERAQMKRLNDDRNVVMARQIMQMLDDSKRLFVAVGSLHMIDSKGLPALLREQGAVVTYVPLARQLP